MRHITPEELKNIQLSILDELDRYCKDNNITYFLHGGTLLGAVRHKGYIPWDDDIDVAMPRPDFDRFFSEYNSNRTEQKYRALFGGNCQEYYLASGKLIDDRTIMKEGVKNDLNIGVYVDIFALDYLPTDMELVKKLDKKVARYRNMLIMKNVPASSERAWYKNAVLSVAGFFLQAVPYSRLLKKIDSLSQTYKDGPDCGNMGVISVFDYGLGEVHKVTDFFPPVKLEFEGRLCSAPNGYDSILKGFYRNYMELPPVEKRVSHHAYEAYWKD